MRGVKGEECEGWGREWGSAGKVESEGCEGRLRVGKEGVWVHSYMIKSMRPILQSKATQEQRAEINMYMHMFISATYCTYLRKRELSSGVVDLLCHVSMTDRS